MASEGIQQALENLTRRAAEAGSDKDKIEEVLNEAITGAEGAQAFRKLARELVERAILAGTNPRALYGRPFSSTYVREIYNELRERGHDLPKLTQEGPKFKRQRS